MRKHENLVKILKQLGMTVLLTAVILSSTAFRDLGILKDVIFPIPDGGIVGWDVPQEIPTPDGDPWFDDFLFYENDVYENGIPTTAMLMPAGSVSGEWKYCLTFNRTFPGEERIDEIGLAGVSFDGNRAEMILHPQYIRFGSHVEPENEASVGYTPFTGTWEDERIEVSANGTVITLGTFYSFEGKDYSLGFIIIKETGLFGDVLLLRP